MIVTAPRMKAGATIPVASSIVATARWACSCAGSPAPSQRVRGRLRPAVAGEDALLVAVDPGDPRARGEVGEVPDVLADHRVDPVEDAVIHVQECGLKLFAPGLADEAVQPGLRVRAV